MSASSNKTVGYSVFILANVVGAAGLLAIGVFMLAGPFDIVDLPGKGAAAFVWNGLLSLAFFLQHSVMARKAFRRWFEGRLPSHYYGAFYTIASGVVLLAVVALWQGSDVTVVVLDGLARWLSRGVFALAMAGFVWGVLALGSFDTFGLDPLRERILGSHTAPKPFTVRGPYRWVRHPLYLATLLFIWSCPDVTVDRLFFNVSWTAWIVVGAVLEERSMVADLGDAYREYQRTVPMLIPYRVWPRNPEKN